MFRDEGGDMPDRFDLAVDDDDEWDEETNDLLYRKYCFEGASTLTHLTAMLRALADELQRRAADGWRLVDPVDGGHAHLVRVDS